MSLTSIIMTIVIIYVVGSFVWCLAETTYELFVKGEE